MIYQAGKMVTPTTIPSEHLVSDQKPTHPRCFAVARITAKRCNSESEFAVRLSGSSTSFTPFTLYTCARHLALTVRMSSDPSVVRRLAR